MSLGRKLSMTLSLLMRERREFLDTCSLVFGCIGGVKSLDIKESYLVVRFDVLDIKAASWLGTDKVLLLRGWMKIAKYRNWLHDAAPLCLDKVL
jgi:hypothetical protein